MGDYLKKAIGWLAVLVGITGILAVFTLALFFVGLAQNIPSLSPLGGTNDRLNILMGILGAILASVLHPTLRKPIPRFSVMVLMGVWAGAVAITYGSWVILSGRGDLELSTYYFFFGNSLIGTWVWVLNRNARTQAIMPPSLTRLGLIAGGFMMIGWLALYGVILRLDGDDFSPLIFLTGISFLGTGILYPIWCLLLGRWILSKS